MLLFSFSLTFWHHVWGNAWGISHWSLISPFTSHGKMHEKCMRNALVILFTFSYHHFSHTLVTAQGPLVPTIGTNKISGYVDGP